MILLVATIASAEPPCTEALPVRLNDVVACDEALLVPPEMARALALCRDVELPACSAALAFAESNSLLTIELLTTELEAEQKLTADLRELLENPPRPTPRWYEHPVVWGSVGVAVGVSLGVGLAVR